MASQSERQKVLSIAMRVRDQMTPALKVARSALEMFRRAATVAMGAVRLAVNAVGAAIRTMLGPIGLITGGIGLYAMARFFKAAADAGDELAKMSKRTGFTVETLSELQYALEISGSNLEEFEVGIKRMQASMFDAERGLKTVHDVLRTLGLTFVELRDQSPEQQFEMIARALTAMRDPTQQAGMTLALFGRSGTQLLPLLKEGEGGIAALREEARKLGLTWTASGAKSAEAFKDSLQRLGGAFKGIRNVIAKELFPVFTAWASAVGEWLSENREAVRQWAHATAVNLLVFSKRVTAVAKLLKDLASDSSAMEQFGAVMFEAGRVAVDAFKETLIAGVRVTSNIITMAARPLIEAAQLLGAEMGKGIRDGVLSWFSKSDAEIANELRQKIEGSKQALAKATQQLASDSLNQLQKSIISENIGFIKAGIDQMRAELSAVEARLNAPAETFAKRLGESVQDVLRGIRTDAGDISDAFSDLGSNISANIEKAVANVVAAGTTIQAVMTPFGIRFIRVVNPAIKEFEERWANARPEVEAMLAPTEALAKAIANLKTNTEEAAEGAQRLIDSARLVRDSEIALMRGRQQAMGQLGAAFDDEIRANQRAVEEGKITQEAYEQWLVNRRELFSQQMMELNGTMGQGFSAGIRDWIDEATNMFKRGYEVAQNLINTIQQGFSDAFAGLIDGTKSVGQAFKEMGANILRVIGEVIAKLIALQVVQSIFGPNFGFGGFEKGGVVPGGSTPILKFAHGGVTPGAGGVVRSPTLFFAGEGRKREAIVPLPDGRAIPAVITDAGRERGGGEMPAINIYIQAADSRDVERLFVENGHIIKGHIMRALAFDMDMKAAVRRVA